MAELQGNRVAVYLDFDNIVMSWYDRVHGRNSYAADRQKIIADPDAPEIAQRLKDATMARKSQASWHVKARTAVPRSALRKRSSFMPRVDPAS